MLLECDFPPDVRVENEATALIDLGHQVNVLCYSRKKDFRHYENINGIGVYRFFLPNLTYKLSALSLTIPAYFNFWRNEIKNHLVTQDYDAIHVHDLPLTKVAIEISKKNNLRLVADFHENRPEIMKMYKHVNSGLGRFLISTKQWKDYQKWCIGQLKHLILVTNEAQKYYEQHYGAKKETIKVVPNFVNTDILSNLNTVVVPEHLKNKFVALYIGDTGKRRGTETILRCAEKLKDRTDIHFVVIGTSNEQAELEAESARLNLKNLELTGFIPFADSLPYFKAARVGLCPLKRNVHHDTTYANKIFQYMAAGLPIVVSDCPSQANVVVASNCGLIHKSEDFEEMARHILFLRSNHAAYESMSNNAREAALTKYNLNVMKKALEEAYSSLD